MDKNVKNTVVAENADGFQSTEAGFAPEDNGTEVVAFNRGDIAGVDLLNDLKNPGSKFYCSIVDDGTRASKVDIYNAVGGACEQLLDHEGKTLEIVDVAAHPIKVTDEKTGEIHEVLRTILIDKEGRGYQAVSEGVVGALQKIYSIIGAPSWKDEPVKMVIGSEKTSNKYTVTTIKLAK